MWRLILSLLHSLFYSWLGEMAFLAFRAFPFFLVLNPSMLLLRCAGDVYNCDLPSEEFNIVFHLLIVRVWI